MLLTLIVLVLIAALTAFLANQGTLTALFTFFSAAFAAVLAIGVMPALAPIIGGLWRPDVGMGVSFLGVFAIVFGALRMGTDMLVPTDIPMPTIINRIGGGVIGLLASAVVIGSLLIGIFMLPIPERILDGGGLKADEDDSSLAVANMPWPVKLTGSILNLANGGAQGGKDLASIYPDLPKALAAYRHTVQSGSNIALLPEMIEIRGWNIPDAKYIQSHSLPTDKGIPTIVRTAIRNNSSAGPATDNDSYLRMTPQQVRLIAKSTTGTGYREYNPIGMLEKGDRFVKFTDNALNTALAEDANDQNQIIHDWVFAINDGYTPVNMEIKAGGLVSFESKPEPKPLEQLAGVQYPPRKYLKDQSTVQVLVKGNDGPLANATVWVLTPAVERRNVGLVSQVQTDIENKASAAGSNASPGTISAGDYRSEMNGMLEIRNAGPAERISWTRLVVPIIKSKTELNDGRRNISVVLPNFMEQTMQRLFKDSGTQVLMSKTGNDGMTPRENLAPGTYTFVGYASTEDSFRLWVFERKVEPKETLQVDMDHPIFRLSIK